MAGYISVEWNFGRPSRGAEEDEARAIAAAHDVLGDINASDASLAYKAQWLEFDDEERMTGLAQVWIAAREAANLALTEGWADPNGAFCDLVA